MSRLFFLFVSRVYDYQKKTSDFIRQNSILQNFTKNSWCILNPIEQSIKAKIEKIGVPLKDWDIKIYRGILTGCNEAFIIDGATKDALIAQDPKSAEIIRPILRGRDIKRYSYEFADKWLIATHNGTPTQERIKIEDYPAVKMHLDSYYAKIAKRDDQGDTPYNLRCCAYWDDFSKQKIVWKRIGSIIRFAIDEKGVCPLDSVCFLTGNENLKYIVGYLNSSFAIKQLLDNSPKTGTGDVIISVQALEPLLIPKCSTLEQEKIENIVDNILKSNDMENFQHLIDLEFKKIFHLTDEEFSIYNLSVSEI